LARARAARGADDIATTPAEVKLRPQLGDVRVAMRRLEDGHARLGADARELRQRLEHRRQRLGELLPAIDGESRAEIDGDQVDGIVAVEHVEQAPQVVAAEAHGDGAAGVERIAQACRR